jgi:formylglycine-generating enzyme required for sulfatase activity
MNHDVFISYSSKNKQTANAICHVLEQNKIKCWIAPRDISIGEKYGDVIERAIRSCKVFIIVFSKESSLSFWVESELNIAFTDRRVIMPFRIDNTKIEGEMRLILNNKHWIDAYPLPDVHFAELVSAVAKQVGIPLSSFKSSFPNDNIPQTQDTKLRAEHMDSERQKGQKKTCLNPDCTSENIPEDAQFCSECGTKKILDLEEIKRKNELQNKEKMKKFFLRIGSIVGLLAILIIAIVFISHFNQNGAYEIQQQKEELAAQQEKQAKLDKVKELITNVYPIEMVTVQGGTFQMGSSDGEDNEKPLHTVTLSTFQIGITEITQAQWESVMGENPSLCKGTNHPVEEVSWNDVQKFINNLNLATGKNYRLPTEAEWEFAARGGIKSKGYKYAGSNNVGEVAECEGGNDGTPKPVGGKKPNELGLYDMSGNVSELCSDFYSEYSVFAQTNPNVTTSGFNRVFRGGSFYDFVHYCRVANRRNGSPDNSYGDLGFRVVLSPLFRKPAFKE